MFPARAALAAAALFILYFFGLNSVGLIGPDEPRYAEIGRSMAKSGDWVTPRLWGEPWFEKPPLLYWMTAAGFRLGLGPDLAPRLPVAAMSAAFLVLLYYLVRAEFSDTVAWRSSLLLATTALWLAFSNVAVTDLPLAACFTLALLAGASGRWWPAGVALGLAMLAKGLVSLVLLVPLFWLRRSEWRKLAIMAAIACAIAAPWYAAIVARHGRAFIDEFILRHHFARFTSEEILHSQPFWFYIPVFLAALMPWTAALPLLFRRSRSETERILGFTVLFGFVFFSASRNKLPGYVLPLVPAACVLIGARLERAPRLMIAAAVTIAFALPALALLVPAALQSGLRRATLPDFFWPVLVGLTIVGCAAGWWSSRAGVNRPLMLAASAVVLGVFWFKWSVYPFMDRTVSARGLASAISNEIQNVCAEPVHRNWEYGLQYYIRSRIPNCGERDYPRLINDIPPKLVYGPKGEYNNLYRD